jgi:diguanylate cyclase (GGDEF)-like protein/PAS domain S-box-containing protein
MRLLSATNIIVLSLSAICVTLLLSANLLGLLPDEREAILQGRVALCESIAINFSLMAEADAVAKMDASLQALRDRNPEILSLGVRRENGQLICEAGDHFRYWRLADDAVSTENQMLVPIMTGANRWGTVEVAFQPLDRPLWGGFTVNPLFVLSLFMAVGSGVAFYTYLARVLRQLNPKQVVPQRVRSALDTLTEGLLLLDKEGRIVLANSAFSTTCALPAEQLLGKKPDILAWKDLSETEDSSSGTPSISFPWEEVLMKGETCFGRLLQLNDQRASDRTFVVNASPIMDEQGIRRGCLASFEDVTQLHRKKVELSHMLDTLRQSAEKIREQNRELERLARQDALTGCFNRRYFLERVEGIWNDVRRGRLKVSLVMVDVDHFKSINDKFGHAAGDDVLRAVGRCLREELETEDLVARFGGEEFVLLLPHADQAVAAAKAEQVRRALQQLQFEFPLTITASFGVASTSEKPQSVHELLEAADRALYFAKRNGRNRVVRSDEVPADLVVDNSKIKRSHVEQTSQIPFPAVTALISALAFRNAETAAHSRRVADRCVAVGQGLMSLGSCYILEMAALLHDIGKMGVPDSILMKPTALTPEEWDIINQHDRIGLEILKASFGSTELSEIVENYRIHFADAREQGVRLPLGARILSIADAYDSMVTDRAYRAGRSPQEAFAELRRCAGTQFDPELVERFIEAVKIERRQAPEIPRIAKEAALEIGLELERFARVVDQQDLPGLKMMAGRLAAGAARAGAHEVSAKAIELEHALNHEEDAVGVLRLAGELLDICRATQASYLIPSADVDLARC